MAEYSRLWTRNNDQVGGRTGKTCEPCQKKNKRTIAVVYCKNCGQFQCKECENVHEIFDFMSGHEIVDVSKAEPLAPKLDLNGLDKCREHNEEFKFFCVDHRLLLCSSCVIKQHRVCREVDELAKQVVKTKPDATGLISTMKVMQSRTTSVIEKAQNAKSDMDSQVNDLPSQIDEARESVMKLFDTLKDKVMKEAKAAKQQISTRLDTKQLESKDILEYLGKSLSKLETIVAHGSLVQIYIALKSLEKQVAKYESVLSEQESSLQAHTFSIEYKQALSNVLAISQGDELGALKIVPDIETIRAEPNVKPAKLTLEKSVEVKQTKYDTEEPLYSGLAFLPDGRLVVGDKQNFNCYIMNEQLDKVGELKVYPDYLAVVSNNEVAVTSKIDPKIYFLRINKNSAISVTKTLHTAFYYNSICLMNDNTFVASTLRDTRQVRMITMEGEEKDFVGLPEKDYEVGNSASTYIRDKDILVITDKKENAVFLYDVKREDYTVDLRCIVKDGRINQPSGVCVGPDCCIFVCSSKPHSIIQVSMSGEVISVFNVDMTFPRAVCINAEQSKLAVSNSALGKKKLNRYKMDVCQRQNTNQQRSNWGFTSFFYRTFKH